MQFLLIGIFSHCLLFHPIVSFRSPCSIKLLHHLHPRYISHHSCIIFKITFPDFIMSSVEWPSVDAHNVSLPAMAISSDLFDGELFGDELIDIYNNSINGDDCVDHNGKLTSHFIVNVIQQQYPIRFLFVYRNSLPVINR
jgi:hypothetical protein